MRHPLVGILDYALHGLRHVAAEQDWRPRLLHWLGPRPDRIEVDVASVKRRLLRSPDRLHGAHAFAEQSPACPRIGAMIGDLLAQPANSDAEEKSAARHHVQTGDFFG